ncbi:hypothetical protein Trydic_g5260 [Trypoxylus dichotomus]
MYPRKASFTILPAKHNLRNVILDTKYSTKHLLRYSNTLRQFLLGDALKNVNNIKKDFLNFIASENIIGIIRKNLSSVPENLKNQSAVIIRTWTHQCECVVAQRLRRGQQMFMLYSKLWEERALKEFFRKLKLQITRHGKEFMISAVGITAYNWDANRIPDSEMQIHINELEYMQILKDNTINRAGCKECQPKSGGKPAPGCKCPHKANPYATYDDWTVFVAKQDMIVWRRPHESGNFEYKVYGSYDDVYAEDFVNVQIDIMYRKLWDTTAVILDIVDKDPNPESNDDIIYWEMLWPKFFSNRDYVFRRRYMLDPNTKTMLLVSRCTDHPAYPVQPNKHRVKDYRSHMVIRPHKDYATPGVEFGLTYYDNPGVNIPAAISSWVAYRAMPEYLNRLRVAAREYQAYCLKNGCDRFFNMRNLDSGKDAKKAEEDREAASVKITDSQPEVLTTTEKYPGFEIMTSPSPIIQAEVSKHNYWKYLQPTYYFS